jgi:hypothetical protein
MSTCSSDHCAPGFSKLLDYAYPNIRTNSAYDMYMLLTLRCAVTSREYPTIVNPLDVRYFAQGHNNIE